MLIVTMETIPGKTIEPIGLVKGSTIQTVNAFKDIGASFKTLVGGELKKYTEMKTRHVRSRRSAWRRKQKSSVMT